MTSPPAIEFRAVTKEFAAIRALNKLDFELYPGEVVGLVGENGAGKSTLIKIISGLHEPDEGETRVHGRRVRISSPNLAISLGISTVYQDFALCNNLDTIANLFLGKEHLRRPVLGLFSFLDEIQMERKATELLESLSVNIPDLRAPVLSLSGGQRQAISIARSLLWKSKIVLFDEPTASLGSVQSSRVLETVDYLRALGTAVVIASHDIPGLLKSCNRIVVLKFGAQVANFYSSSVSYEEVLAAMTGSGPGRRVD
jgi:D-xylose transport system ATP-binding protein